MTDSSFGEDLPEVLNRAHASGVERIVVTGTDLASTSAAAKLVTTYPDMLSYTAGIHPHHADAVGKNWQSKINQLASFGAVAIGETGLDYFRNFSSLAAQQSVFEAQLDLAADLDLPVFVHDRDSDGDVMHYLSNCAKTPTVVHCFTGDQQLLLDYLELGCYIGLTGWVCDERRGAELALMTHLIPDDRLLIETDSPYLMPRNMEPRPKNRRNEPQNLRYVLRKVAQLRGQSEEEVDRFTTENAKRFFRLS